jgi:hypothetical protein
MVLQHGFFSTAETPEHKDIAFTDIVPPGKVRGDSDSRVIRSTFLSPFCYNFS